LLSAAFSCNILVMKTYISLLLLFLTFNIYSQSEPHWINNFPVDDEYYAGIGSSNSGNKSNDYERALIQAKLNLASEISTTIKSEIQIVTRDTSNGGFSETFNEKLNQSVEQNLSELEIVDTYYSRTHGYWIYIRLNKSRWVEIQNEEMSLLLSRVQQILDDDYFGSRITTADKLFKLAAVSTILYESPYRSILNGEIGDFYSGNVHDFVLSDIYKISSSISILVNSDIISLEAGKDYELRFSGKSQDYYPGKLPFVINSNGSLLYSVSSDTNGLARVSMQSVDLQEGSNILEIQIDPMKIGFPGESPYISNFYSEKQEIPVNILSSSVYLSINTNQNRLGFLIEPVGTLFSTGNEKFHLAKEKSEASFEIVVTLNFTEYPRVLENAPLMAGLDCIISLNKDNRLLLEHKINSMKDGGLTYEQAYRRVFNKLIDKLENDRTYIREIEKEILQ